MTRAFHVAQMVEDVDLYGGIVLNAFVGGINAIAVSAALHMGAKVVWMPTMHAKNHFDEIGPGTYGVGSMTLNPDAVPPNGITVLDRNGSLTEDAHQVIEQVGRAGALLATGHLGGEEVVAVARAAKEANTRCLVTHAFFPSRSMDTLTAAVALGAMVEVSAVVTYPMARHMGHSLSLSDVHEIIQTVGIDNVVVSSDAGQVHNPPAPDVLRAFVNALVVTGGDPSAIRSTIVERPRELLGIHL